MTQRVKLELHGAEVKALAHEALAEGLGLGAEHLLQVSRERVPLEEGTLERSGVASVDEEALQAGVSYDTVYAVRQHEELDWRHDPGRTAKYLEAPMVEEHDTLVALVGAPLRGELH
jgi:hypothetical protein